MRVLLDESLPQPLGRLLVGHAVRTVGQAGWASFKNGILLRLASTDFDVLVTADQNIEFQQNLPALQLAVSSSLRRVTPEGGVEVGFLQGHARWRVQKDPPSRSTYRRTTSATA